METFIILKNGRCESTIQKKKENKMDKNTLEFLLNITENSYADYLSNLLADNRGWLTDSDGCLFPLMSKYRKAIEELKRELEIDK